MTRSSRSFAAAGVALAFGLTAFAIQPAAAATGASVSPPAQLAAKPAADTMKAKKKMAHKASPRVKAAQMALAQEGYKIKADGVLGPKTRAALMEYQAKHKLKANGRLDKATVAALKIR